MNRNTISKIVPLSYRLRYFLGSIAVELVKSDEIDVFVARSKLETFRNFFLQMKNLVEKVLELQVERIDSLTTSLGRLSALLGSNLVQTIQLLEGQEVKREFVPKLVHLVDLESQK